MKKILTSAVLAGALVLASSPAIATAATLEPSASTMIAVQPLKAKQDTKKYKNCAELTKKYSHGVGKKGAVDKANGKPKKNGVKNFRVDNVLYSKNTHLDRDKDGIACER